MKEIVTDKNPHKPKIDSDATQTLLIEATKRGLPVILHNDRGVPGERTSTPSRWSRPSANGPAG